MAWQDSFDAMVAADLESSFFGDSEFSDTLIVTQRDARPRTINCQVVETTTTIQDGSHHGKLVAVIHVMAKDDPTTGIQQPIEGDFVRWNDRSWNFMAVKSADLGARVITFQEAVVTRRGHNRSPSL